MRKFKKLCVLAMRFSDGGAAPAPAATNPAPSPAPPAPADPKPAETPAKTFTEAEVEAAKAEAIAAYKAHLDEAKDYEKMTPEEKVAYLEAKAESDKLAAYTTQQLAAASMPVELVKYVQGKTEAETNEHIKDIKALLEKGVQEGVNARFKQNSFIPRSSTVSGSRSAAGGSFIEAIKESQAKRD